MILIQVINYGPNYFVQNIPGCGQMSQYTVRSRFGSAFMYLFQGKQQISAATNYLRSSAETVFSSHFYFMNEKVTHG